LLVVLAVEPYLELSTLVVVVVELVDTARML
jgi:hypothetical protein